jgi:hypothetical protein
LKISEPFLNEKANELRHASGVPSAFRPHPIAFHSGFIWRGEFFLKRYGDGVSGGFPFKKETAKFKM